MHEKYLLGFQGKSRQTMAPENQMVTLLSVDDKFLKPFCSNRISASVKQFGL